jgi:hypothetical protein
MRQCRAERASDSEAKPPAQREPEPPPSAVVSPSPGQSAVQQPHASVKTEKSPEQQKTAFWDAKTY